MNELIGIVRNFVLICIGLLEVQKYCTTIKY